jgi:O-antigen ligase
MVSLGLSLVRTAWLGYAISLLVLFSPRRGRLLRAGVASLLVPVALVLVAGGPAKDVLVDRFAQTTTSGQSDTSFQDRVEFHERLLPTALMDPFGTGFGAVGVATKLGNSKGELADDANFDGGALELLFTFGGLLGLAVLAMTVVAVARGWSRARGRGDLERALAAALIGLVVQLLLYQPLVTPTGILLFVGLALLAREPVEDADAQDADGLHAAP